jgi:hypothetical protein
MSSLIFASMVFGFRRFIDKTRRRRYNMLHNTLI